MAAVMLEVGVGMLSVMEIIVMDTPKITLEFVVRATSSVGVLDVVITGVVAAIDVDILADENVNGLAAVMTPELTFPAPLFPPPSASSSTIPKSVLEIPAVGLAANSDFGLPAKVNTEVFGCATTSFVLLLVLPPLFLPAPLPLSSALTMMRLPRAIKRMRSGQRHLLPSMAPMTQFGFRSMSLGIMRRKVARLLVLLVLLRPRRTAK